MIRHNCAHVIHVLHDGDALAVRVAASGAVLAALSTRNGRDRIYELTEHDIDEIDASVAEAWRIHCDDLARPRAHAAIAGGCRG